MCDTFVDKFIKMFLIFFFKKDWHNFDWKFKGTNVVWTLTGKLSQNIYILKKKTIYYGI